MDEIIVIKDKLQLDLPEFTINIIDNFIVIFTNDSF